MHLIYKILPETIRSSLGDSVPKLSPELDRIVTGNFMKDSLFNSPAIWKIIMGEPKAMYARKSFPVVPKPKSRNFCNSCNSCV